MKTAILKWFSTVQTIKDSENKLTQATFANTPTYTLKGMKTKCKPLKVCSGDILWIAIIIERRIRKIRVRVFGWDPVVLESLMQLEKLLDIEFLDYDKYGCPLVKLCLRKE